MSMSWFAQDCLLPYMADQRHTPDTLFIVCEEDWRLYRTEGEASPEALAAHMARWRSPDETCETTWDPQELYAQRCAAVPLRGEEQASRTESLRDAKVKPVGRDLYVRRRRPHASEVEPPSKELQDIVRICTAAHRRGHGGFVWLCYESTAGKNARRRKRAPAHGFMAVAITAECARKWHQEFNAKFQFKHWDIAVRDVLESEPETAERWQASFVYPPIGNYVSHTSGCEVGLGRRESSWDKAYVQEGTRRDLQNWKSQHRELFAFAPGGKQCERLAEVLLPEDGDEDLRWFTCMPQEAGVRVLNRSF